MRLTLHNRKSALQILPSHWCRLLVVNNRRAIFVDSQLFMALPRHLVHVTRPLILMKCHSFDQTSTTRYSLVAAFYGRFVRRKYSIGAMRQHLYVLLITWRTLLASLVIWWAIIVEEWILTISVFAFLTLTHIASLHIVPIYCFQKSICSLNGENLILIIWCYVMEYG